MVVINNPPANTTTDSSGGTGFLLAIVLIVVLVILFMVYGLPNLRGSNSTTPQINVPDKVDVNVNPNQK